MLGNLPFPACCVQTCATGQMIDDELCFAPEPSCRVASSGPRGGNLDGIRSAAVWLFPPAWAHHESGHAGSFVAGFLHPSPAPDHGVAMVAVGQVGAPSCE